MKKIIFFSILVFIYSTSYACFFKKFGKNCPNKNDGNQVNIYNGGYGSYAQSKAQGTSDGGATRKRDAGDKSKNQGYADYKEHFLYYSYELWSAPHQEGFHRSSDTANRSYAYEFAFNPFVSIKGQKTDLLFSGLRSGHQLKQEHLLAIMNLRLYLLNDFVIRAGMGVGRSKIKSEGSSVGNENYEKQGSTEVLQFSVNYLFGAENTMLGITSTTIQGISGDKNLGSSSYGINVGIGF